MKKYLNTETNLKKKKKLKYIVTKIKFINGYFLSTCLYNVHMLIYFNLNKLQLYICTYMNIYLLRFV